MCEYKQNLSQQCIRVTNLMQTAAFKEAFKTFHLFCKQSFVSISKIGTENNWEERERGVERGKQQKRTNKAQQNFAHKKNEGRMLILILFAVKLRTFFSAKV